MAQLATLPPIDLRRATALPRIAFRILGARLAAEVARHRAVRMRRRELDDLLMAADHVFQDIGVTRLDVVHERLAIRTWF